VPVLEGIYLFAVAKKYILLQFTFHGSIGGSPNGIQPEAYRVIGPRKIGLAIEVVEFH
jgi:hypothetical protein